MTHLRIPRGGLRYRVMIGVGGIGSGAFFALDGNETLGREESRSGRFLDRRDYCKLHIIAHYVRALLGPDFATIPVGRVGDDDAGRRIFGEMAESGLEMRYVERCAGLQTAFSLCLTYPDGSGGNLTTADSACSTVNGELVERASEEFRTFRDHGVALAAPEVPLQARRALLERATADNFFRVASFTSGEMPAVVASDLIGLVDLLAVNREEAAAGCGITDHKASALQIVERFVACTRERNPSAWLSVTTGAEGSWCWDGVKLAHFPALRVPVENTAGAGDAHLAGVIAGLAVDLPPPEAQQLGTLLAALSVTSPHTIHPAVTRRALRTVARESHAPLSERVLFMLEDGI
jgi:sugar/nucleoside kinase (ribokinase family)